MSTRNDHRCDECQHESIESNDRKLVVPIKSRCILKELQRKAADPHSKKCLILLFTHPMQNFKIPEDKKKDLENFKTYLVENSTLCMQLLIK